MISESHDARIRRETLEEASRQELIQLARNTVADLTSITDRLERFIQAHTQVMDRPHEARARVTDDSTTQE